MASDDASHISTNMSSLPVPTITSSVPSDNSAPPSQPSRFVPMGKGGKGGVYGKGGKYPKRHRNKKNKELKHYIRNPAVRRLMRRGGVKRINGLVYEESRGVIKQFLENIIRIALAYTENARRKTMTAVDILYALKREGITLYGFGN